MQPMILIVKRDITHILKQKFRFVSTLIRPLLWLFIIGAGIRSFTPEIMGYNYQQFIVPGLIAMMLLFSGLLSALSLLKEKFTGFIRVLLVAPISRTQLLISKLISASIISILYVMFFYGICLLFGLATLSVDLILFFCVCFISALLWSAAGLLIGLFSRDLENFSIIMNFVVFPIFFLSNALYPLKSLPSVIYYIALFNPLTYCVDAFYHVLNMHQLSHFPLWQSTLIICLCIVAITSVSIYKFNKQCFNEL